MPKFNWFELANDASDWASIPYRLSSSSEDTEPDPTNPFYSDFIRRYYFQKRAGRPAYIRSHDPSTFRLPNGISYQPEEGAEDVDLLRRSLLSQLIDEELLKSRYKAMFVDPAVISWRLRFEVAQPQPMREYATFFQAIASIYELLATLQVARYFTLRWLQDRAVVFLPEHELRLVSLTRASPDDARLEGIGAGLKALGDALSIGKQYQEIRTSNEKIREAKAAARKAELEVETKEKEMRLADGVEADTLRLEIARRRADLRIVLLKVEEEELKLRRQKRQDLDETLSLIQKHAPVLEKLPEQMRDQVLLELSRSISVVHDSPFEIIEYSEFKQLPDEQQAPPPAPTV